MTNYGKGARFENDVKRDLERRGFVVIRAAGSHGEADLVALAAGKDTLFVQCKYDGRLDPEPWNQHFDESLKAGAVAILAWRGWRGNMRAGIVYKVLVGRKGEGIHNQPFIDYEFEEE